MNEHDYVLVWGLYAIAALGCLLVFFRLTGWMWRYLAEPLRVVVAVLLFTPTIVDPSKDLYAPAVAISALDLLFKVGSNIWRAVADLAMYGMIAFAVYLLFVLIRWPIESAWKKRQAAKAAPEPDAEDQPTLREMMEREPLSKPYIKPRSDSRDEPRTPPASSSDGRRVRIEPRL
ncbi:MAG: MFS transporter [Pseudomonas sp.]